MLKDFGCKQLGYNSLYFACNRTFLVSKNRIWVMNGIRHKNMSHTHQEHRCNRHRLSIQKIFDRNRLLEFSFLMIKRLIFPLNWFKNFCSEDFYYSVPETNTFFVKTKLFEQKKFKNHWNCERQKVGNNLCTTGTSSSSHFWPSSALLSPFKLLWPSEQKCYPF